MSSRMPMVRQISWISIIPQVILMLLLVISWDLLRVKEPFFFGIITYLTIYYCLTNFIPKYHRKGIALIKKEKFLDAIQQFEESYAFFNKHNWPDKYRSIFILSPTLMYYKEMALNNIGFCYGQIGDGTRSKEYYERTLNEYPNNILAKVALNLLKSGTDIEKK
jgi:tetratricopeptide (TPR) repeat protein